MALEFQISSGSSVPIYRQIVDQARKAVASGILQEGDQLPSVRGLAEQLVVNPNTVAHAYGELVQIGLAESQHGKGLFIAKQRQMFSREERSRRLNQALEAFLLEASFLDFNADEIREMLTRKLSETRPASPRRKGGQA